MSSSTSSGLTVSATAPSKNAQPNSPSANPNPNPNDTFNPPSTQQFLRRCKLLVGTQGMAAGTKVVSTYTNSAGQQAVEKVAPTPAIPKGGIDLSALRISFVVNRNTLQQPNNAKIRVYNVAPATVTQIQKEFTQVFLQVGYGSGALSTIFNGTVIRMMRGASPIKPEQLPPAVLPMRESQVDTFLEFVATDGDMPYNFATISVALAAKSTPDQQLQQVLNALAPYGIGKGYVNYDSTNLAVLPRGIVLHGMVRDVLDNFCKWTNTTWSVQDGMLEIVAKHQGAIPGNAIVISSKTGLINQPRETVNGVEFTTLMNPYLRPGRAVKIAADIQQDTALVGLPFQSLSQNQGYVNPLNPQGFYRIFWYQHIGDTRGQPWYTNCVARTILPDGSSGQNPGSASTIQYGV